MIWEAAHGTIPFGAMVLHRCDNPACYNLDHLYLGTAADNSQDMVDRHRISRPNAKLVARDVRIIRTSTKTNRALADQFNVDPTTISLIRRGRTWKDVK